MLEHGCLMRFIRTKRDLWKLSSLRIRPSGSFHSTSSQLFNGIKGFPPTDATLADRYESGVEQSIEEDGNHEWHKQSAVPGPTNALCDNQGRSGGEPTRVGRGLHKCRAEFLYESKEQSAKHNDGEHTAAYYHRKTVIHGGEGKFYSMIFTMLLTVYPVTFDIASAEEAAGPFASTAQEEAEFNVVEDGEAECFIAAAFLVGRGSHEVEGADADIGFGFVAVGAGEPAQETNQEKEMPGAYTSAFQCDPWGEGNMVCLFCFGNPR